MSNDNKTLADVQPGGRVRLGDQAERPRFEAWGRTEGLPLARAKLGGYAFEVTAKAWLAWQYLSAQPSPGGQDARAQFEGYRGGDCERDAQGYYVNSRTAQDWAMWQAALSARQPVGEPAAWVHEEDPERVISARQKATALRDQGASGSSVRPYSVPAYLHAPPAQAVDLANVIDQIAQQWDGCNYDAVGETIDVGQAIRAAAGRLIDSQAVGK
ncbi:hypothetical protein VPH13_03060 [Stenotrophomonas pavanii]|uniref:hypothetical protein n=1 Tax=Stenotrophomonas pavanii TaxID=487698 RepID=UPI002DBAF03C|nr:hypothetical protein [Stenotrophomonas pavanii]MEC4337705.1 hypothetical protein [Stenotrophomonas pavanii]